MSILIAGIDGSLSSTGVAVYNPDTGASVVRQIVIHSPYRHVGERCETIASFVCSFIRHNDAGCDADTRHIFIEEPAGMLKGYAQDLRVLYWAIVRHIEGSQHRHPNIYPVPPNTLKKMLTGRGNCKPEDKALAVLTKFKHMIPEEYIVSPDKPGGLMAKKDAYDAIGLAALGHCVLGGDGYTKAQMEAVAKITQL